MHHPAVFWDVDTQHDFMDATGKLYVKDAEQIKDNLRRLTEYAHAKSIPIIASADDHEPGHRELSSAPDFRETFPEHCMRGSPGAEKIAETALEKPLVIEPDGADHNALARQLYAHKGDVLLRKHWFDVFTNPNAETLLDTWAPTEVVVYGVALDVCNKFAIEGMIERGVPTIFLVTDATKAIHPEDAPALLESWEGQGVRMVTTADVLAGKVV
ncbi:MAG: cysteine hydrolase [Gemmatimonadota bacterium]|nr:cysteine hydrolase [Gemmatimonadota bacterium]